MDVGPGMPDFINCDVMFFVNLRSGTIDLPKFGAGTAGYQWPLCECGYSRDPQFGGTGAAVLGSLEGQAVYATLILEGIDGPFTVSGEIGGAALVATADSLANGGVLYLVPEPASLAFLAIGGLACCHRSRGRRRR
jgi:hypothetical protein